MMNKKAQGLSMNVIIIAAIALLVLVILAVLIFKSGGDIQKGTSCESLHGTCQSSGLGCDTGAGEIQNPGGRCSGQDMICCINLNNA